MPTTFTTDDQRYEAIAEHDPAAMGQFITGVLTTGIFCTPGCPARTPFRKNVRFFASPREALLFGLRPCRRCHPLGATVSNDDHQLLGRCTQALVRGEDMLAEAAERGEALFADLLGMTSQEFAQQAALAPDESRRIARRGRARS